MTVSGVLRLWAPAPHAGSISDIALAPKCGTSESESSIPQKFCVLYISLVGLARRTGSSVPVPTSLLTFLGVVGGLDWAFLLGPPTLWKRHPTRCFGLSSHQVTGGVLVGWGPVRWQLAVRDKQRHCGAYSLVYQYFKTAQFQNASYPSSPHSKPSLQPSSNIYPLPIRLFGGRHCEEPTKSAKKPTTLSPSYLSYPPYFGLRFSNPSVAVNCSPNPF